MASIRRPETSVDYVGALLIAIGVSVLLIWVTFVNNSFDWISWQTFAMVGAAIVLLVLAVWVETVVREPVVPLHVVRRRVPALAILASLAVGMAMFGGAVFLGQYFQIGRGYSPTEAGLLTIPMMFGVLVSSTISGRMVSRSGRVKPYILVGSIVLTLGFLALSTIDHQTSLVLVGAGMLVVGVGVGMSMQNLVLAVQNTVPLRELGAASGAVTFFRSLGGTIGVSILGAVLANRVTENIVAGLAKAGIRPTGSQGGGTLNIKAMPEPIRTIVRAAYGDATGHIFLISACIAVVGILAVLFLPQVRLRDSVDLAEPTAAGAHAPAAAESR
ncbi:UNVERIFIED_ORG: MFS family permease [Microbispora rosea subsp. rosea]